MHAIASVQTTKFVKTFVGAKWKKPVHAYWIQDMLLHKLLMQTMLDKLLPMLVTIKNLLQWF